MSSSNSHLIAVAKFVRDLLTYNEQLIKVGRQGDERVNFASGYIVIDELQPARRVGQLEDFNGAAEALKLGTMYQGRITLDFYGDGAYTRAEEYAIRCRSQAAKELKRTLGIDLQQPGQIINVGVLTGQQWGERYQVEQTITYPADVTITTLRIDTAQIEIRTEEGIQNG